MTTPCCLSMAARNSSSHIGSAGDQRSAKGLAVARPCTHTNNGNLHAKDPSVKLEALESVVPPELRSGRFKATDKLIASLRAATLMRSKTTQNDLLTDGACQRQTPRNNTPCIRTRVRRIQAKDDLESLERVYVGIQGTGPDSTVQGNCQAN